MSAIDWDAVVDVLKSRGWFKGSIVNGDAGQVCLLGAVALVGNPDVDLHALREVVSDYRQVPAFAEANRVLEPILREYGPELPDSSFDAGDHVWEFNDWPGTTLQDVIVVCEKARAES